LAQWGRECSHVNGRGSTSRNHPASASKFSSMHG
jgi:hypothetical protein